MVKSVSGQTAPLQTAPGKPSPAQAASPDPAADPAPAADQTPPASLATASSLQLGVTPTSTPLKTGDLSFPPTSSAARQTGVSPEQLKALSQLLSGVDGDMDAFLKAIVAGQGPQDLDMSKGLNYSMSLLFASGSKEADQLCQSLEHLCRGLASPPDPNCSLDKLGKPQLDALKRMGLLVHEGKVYNLANKQEVSLKNLQGLRQVAGARSESLGPKALGETQASMGLRRLGGLMQDAAMQLGSLKATQGRIEAETGNMDALRGKLERLKGDAQSLMAKVEHAEQELIARTSVFQSLQAFERGIKQEGPGFALQAGNLALLNQAVKGSGLELRLVGGQLQYRDGAGKSLSAAEGQSRLRSAIAAQQQQVEAGRKELESQAGALKALDGQSAAVDSALKLSMLVSDALSENQTQQLSDFEAGPAQALEARRTDPATPAAERRQIEQLLGDFSQARVRAPELRERAQAARGQAAQTREEINAIRNALRQVLAGAGDAMSRRMVAENLQQRLDELTAPPGPALELVSELEDKAAKSEAMLNLAPRPADVDVEKMAKEWTILLTELVQKFDELQASEQDKSQVQKSFASTQTRSLQREAEYHLRRLKQLDSRQHERVEDSLREAIAGMRKQLSVLVPQTSEGLR